MIDITAYGLLPHTSTRVKVGDTFGRYTVLGIGKTPRSDHKFRASAVVSCSCGSAPRVADIYFLAVRRTQTSCGCARIESCSTHGMSGSPLYKRWAHIKARCYNPNNEKYPLYGGRGIVMCDRWLDFANFAADMSDGFKPGLEIERDSVNGNYEPGNCRWVTHAQQARNKRTTRNLTFNGRIQCMARWAAELGLTTMMISYRLDVMKWDVEKTLSTPPMTKAQTTEIARNGRRGRKVF